MFRKGDKKRHGLLQSLMLDFGSSDTGWSKVKLTFHIKSTGPHRPKQLLLPPVT